MQLLSTAAVLYARVSSADQKADLDCQVVQIATFVAEKGRLIAEDHADTLVRTADASLYEAKRAGWWCRVCVQRLRPLNRRAPDLGVLERRDRHLMLKVTDERGAVVSVFLAVFGLLLLAVLAVAADFGRMRLHREELRQAADAASLAGAVGGARVRVDARGRVYDVRLDSTAARNAAIEAFWLNTNVSRAARLMGTIQADAWVDPADPTAVIVSVQAEGETPFAALFGRGQQRISLVSRAKAEPR